MKDIVIKGSFIKRELWILLGSITLALLLNVYSIARFDTDWSELYSTIHVTLLFGLVIYAVVALIRLLVMGIIALVSLSKKKS
jgi:uncharacterized membrane protein